MKTSHGVSKHLPVLAIGIFLILFFSMPQAAPRTAIKTLYLKGEVSARIEIIDDYRGVWAAVSIQGPGNCDKEVALNSWSKQREHIRDRLCDSGGAFGDVYISGTVSIENYQYTNGTKSFTVRVSGHVKDRTLIGTRLYLDEDDQTEEFIF